MLLWLLSLQCVPISFAIYFITIMVCTVREKMYLREPSVNRNVKTHRVVPGTYYLVPTGSVNLEVKAHRVYLVPYLLDQN